MSMFESEVVEGRSPYQDQKLGDQDNGFTFAFYYDNKTTAVSKDYGEFQIFQGLKADLELKTEEAILESAVLASMIPNTMIQNLVKNGGMARGEMYIITKKWSKGDKFNGKKSQGHGYEIARVKAPDVFLDKLKARHLEILPADYEIPGADKTVTESKPAPVEI